MALRAQSTAKNSSVNDIVRTSPTIRASDVFALFSISSTHGRNRSRSRQAAFTRMLTPHAQRNVNLFAAGVSKSQKFQETRCSNNINLPFHIDCGPV
jgi:hypothetical protein